MTSLRTTLLSSVLLLTAVALAPACDDDPKPAEETGGTSGSAGKGGGSHTEAGAGGVGGAGTAACEEIGHLCHEAESSELGAECHELGHTGDGEVCLDRYEECISFCTDYLAGGGAGGAEHGHAGEGGAAHGEGGAAHGGAAHGGAGGA
ncbi:MAG TPA: hypothetical protein VM686_05320 [Polyangiaceae bacterium]|nr:hypothetical protein [Polyangiaceae bacterium]